MKKNKMIFKVSGDNRGKIYIGRKWQKDVTEINIHGEPHDYTIEIKRYKRDARGCVWVVDGEIATETKTYKICTWR